MKTIWITGGGTGIGRALAHAYAEQGAQVWISGRTLSTLEATKNTANPSTQNNIFCHVLDVCDVKATQNLLILWQQKQILPDLIILNAGTYRAFRSDDFDLKFIQETMNVNFMGVINSLSVILPEFVARGSGQIAVVGSVAGDTGLPLSGPYGASKAALRNFIQGLIPELKTKGVDLRLISPGYVATPLTAQNEFKMPFLVSPEFAAQKIMRGLAGKTWDIRFPWRMSLSIRVIAHLPQWIKNKYFI